MGIKSIDNPLLITLNEETLMKALNYSKQYGSYKEMFDDNPELYVSIESEGVDILKERMPFGKYCGMTFLDLIAYDKSYFHHIRDLILREPVSTSLGTYSQRVKMIRVMFSVERYYTIERLGEDYERRKRDAESASRESIC